jgi:excisionase family DNA binding protein
VFAEMLAKGLRRRIGPASGARPEIAAQLKADFAELRRSGDEWEAARRISVGVRPVTEMAAALPQEMSPKQAGEMLNRTDSRVRQLLRRGDLPGRRDGRRWVVRRADVEAYRDGAPRKVAA